VAAYAVGLDRKETSIKEFLNLYSFSLFMAQSLYLYIFVYVGHELEKELRD
jgi:hypothetical protein